jgi:hypothetical protein
MALNFPNSSRNYDPSRRCVRFWGHDSAFEVPFYVEEDVLFGISPEASRSEPSLLDLFDANRPLILKVAADAYARRRQSYYRLSPADFVPPRSKEKAHG